MESDVTVGDAFSKFGEEKSLENLSYISFTEIFNSHLPFFLSIGMSYEQYWNDDCCITKYYRKAFNLQRERMNEQLWLQGLYIYDAILDVAPALRAMGAKQPEKYPNEPYPITDKEIELRKEKQAKEHQENIIAKTEALAIQINNSMKKREKKDNV